MSESGAFLNQVLWVPAAYVVVEKALVTNSVYCRAYSNCLSPSLSARDMALAEKVFPKHLDLPC